MTTDEKTALWAALWAMVHDVHAPQDRLTPAQWLAAEQLLVQLDAEINLDRAPSSAAPPSTP